ncbi:hypothetical protein SCUCBS95973_004346 [Sporothrix curviconia]|uniref:L-2-hydroxyglutarate dehydrogenase, mitochondrial n=1 Tax=Sporothrix curviconia TaxID=1260050 RepID=A0ABP0BNH0_9PEZI
MLRCACQRLTAVPRQQGRNCVDTARLFSVSASRRADFTHAVIGGGVVGLAVARALAERAAAAPLSSASSSAAPASASSVLLLERHSDIGTETSSRNSEVIHGGLYYGADSLKTQLCIRGRQLLYAFCEQYGVGHRRTGKWIVAQTPGQREALEKIHAFAQSYRGGRASLEDDEVLPLRWVAADEAKRREPAVRAAAGVLESLSTGIVDSHGLMQTLLGLFEQAGGVLAAGSPLVKITPLGSGGSGGSDDDAPGSRGWQLHVKPADADEETVVTAETIVNAAGLGAAAVHNMITQRDSSGNSNKEPPMKLYYAKGNYFSYAASQPRVTTLVYPAPEPGLGGLGTHLTLDLAGRIRFGPDVEWVDDPTNLAVNAAQLPRAIEAIKTYLPGVDASALQPDYAGMRPKLLPAGGVAKDNKAPDFVVRSEPGYQGWVNLLGIESPGLTSSLAIGEMVEKLVYSS